MNTTEIIDAGSNNSMSNFGTNGMEEETTGTNIEPNVLEVKIGDDMDPNFCWKRGEIITTGKDVIVHE